MLNYKSRLTCLRVGGGGGVQVLTTTMAVMTTMMMMIMAWWLISLSASAVGFGSTSTLQNYGCAIPKVQFFHPNKFPLQRWHSHVISSYPGRACQFRVLSMLAGVPTTCPWRMSAKFTQGLRWEVPSRLDFVPDHKVTYAFGFKHTHLCVRARASRKRVVLVCLRMRVRVYWVGSECARVLTWECAEYLAELSLSSWRCIALDAGRERPCDPSPSPQPMTCLQTGKLPSLQPINADSMSPVSRQNMTFYII